MDPKGADVMADSVGPDQTAPLHCLSSSVCPLRIITVVAMCTTFLWLTLIVKNMNLFTNEPRHEKTCFAIWEQQMRRSACASAQSDQRLCYSLPR